MDRIGVARHGWELGVIVVLAKMRFGASILKSFFTIAAATSLVVVVVGWYYLLHEMDGASTSHSLRPLTPLVNINRAKFGAVPVMQVAVIQENLSPHKSQLPHTIIQRAAIQEGLSSDRRSPPLSYHHYSARTKAVPRPFTQTGQVNLNPFNTDDRSIHSDLLRCSSAMGISEDRLREKSDSIRRVEQSTIQFLDAVRLVVPELSHFTHHKNPSFYSNVTIGNYLNTIMQTYLQPEVGKGLERLRKVFSPQRLLKMVARRKSLMCLPHFYIAGFPKCATTSLHDAVQRHPQVVAPSSKEPHWWTRVDDLSDGRNFPRDYAMFYVWTYLMFFKEACEKIDTDSDNDDIITYDGSQSLLWDSNFFQGSQDYCAMPAVLSRVQPNAKFIIVMRNPTARLYSHFIWSFKYHLGNLKKWPAKIRQNSSDSFHSEVVSVSKRFKECLKLFSLYECASGSKLPVDRLKDSVSRIGHKFYIGLYYVHIKKWLQFFPRKQFLFLRMEDMVANFTRAMAQIVDFLALRPVASEQMEKWLTKANSRIGKLASDEKFLIQNRTKALLDEVYGPYNRLLADLLDDERYLWADLTSPVDE